MYMIVKAKELTKEIVGRQGTILILEFDQEDKGY